MNWARAKKKKKLSRKTWEIQVSRRTKRYAKKKKKSLGLELRDSNSETFHGMFAI